MKRSLPEASDAGSAAALGPGVLQRGQSFTCSRDGFLHRTTNGTIRSDTGNATLRLGATTNEFDFTAMCKAWIVRITDQFAPRIGFSWDVGGNRNSKIFANYGR